jgi:hypothetical protein
MALNIQPPSDDSDQMISVEVVRKVAKKYAEANDWCGTVDEALSEMGIEDGVTDDTEFWALIQVPMLIQVYAPREDLIGLTEEEEKSAVGHHVRTYRTPTFTTSGEWDLGSEDVAGPVVIESLSMAKPATVGVEFDGQIIPPGYVGKYALSGSRIHLVRSTGDHWSRCGSVDLSNGSAEERGTPAAGICKRCLAGLE